MRRLDEPVEVRETRVTRERDEDPEGGAADDERRSRGPAGVGESAEVRAHGHRAGARPEQFIWRGRLYVVRSVVDHWRERRAWWRDLVDGARVLEIADGSLDPLAPESLEHEIWRVEASPGRLAGSGVYDLRCAHGRWSLVRLAD